MRSTTCLYLAAGIAAALHLTLGLASAESTKAPRRSIFRETAQHAGAAICDGPVWTVEGWQTDGRFGTVAPAGDVNGDGYADVLVGAYNLDSPEVDEGAVFLYLGGPLGLSTTPAWEANSNQAGARLGDKLSGAGDVNGDGFDDVIIGAAFFDSLCTDGGAAFLYMGSAAGLDTVPEWIAVGDQPDAQFGACVQAAGDVNADGYSDVIIGAWLYDHGEPNEGRAYVYMGSDSGLAATPAWTGESDFPGAAYGYFCASAGDVNGDGFDEIVVGARRFSGNGLAEEGRVCVYHGSPAGPSLAATWTRDAGQERSEFGAYTISAGDVNGDGYDDLLVGAFRYENPDLDEGKAYLFLGSADGLATDPAWEDEGDVARNNFGYHLDGAGDVNGDGYDDVIISAPGVDTQDFTYRNAGEAYVYLGSASGLSEDATWTQRGDQDHMSLEAVRGVGDVNGDGFDDVATGALYRDSDYIDGGRAWVFHGCPEGVANVPGRRSSRISVSVTGPNPFQHSTTIGFSCAETGAVRVSVYDLLGRKVRTLVHATLEPGRHEVSWNGHSADGRRVPAGLYLATLEAFGERRGVKLLRVE
ncbi:MAG TPA: FG-GAP-like repeat-containing protein [Candidatus Limnocylindria bacterium]|nr:FG-GAP-like repeat-containing protein [Candidatus Limnocylindria bacterium]